MPETHSPVAEQFDDAEQQKEASTLGMWTFIATEILFFGVMFNSYIISRTLHPEAFKEAGRHTIVLYGTVNAATLLTSSLTVALAVRAAMEGKTKWLVRYLLMTIALACCFLGVKGLEYYTDVQNRLFPGPNFRPELRGAGEIFWFLYWAMTGLHVLHVLIGIGLLSVMAVLSSRQKFSATYHTPVEMVALYWCFVDIVWIFLYPLFYLINGHE